MNLYWKNQGKFKRKLSIFSLLEVVIVELFLRCCDFSFSYSILFYFPATYGELNMGMDLFEGDIKLTERQRKFVESSRSVSNVQIRALISDPSKLWNGGEVPYEIDSSLSE